MTMKYCDTCKLEVMSKNFSRHKKSKKHKLKEVQNGGISEVQNGGIEEQNRDTEVKNGGTEVQKKNYTQKEKEVILEILQQNCFQNLHGKNIQVKNI